MLTWWRNWRTRRACFHHNNRTGESWIGPGSIIDYRKYYRCRECGTSWIK